MGSLTPAWRLLAALLCMAAANSHAAGSMTTSVMDLELAALDGAQFVRLSSHAGLAGRPVLINFWGSECPPCIREMPLLNAQAQLHPQIAFIGIAVDDRQHALRYAQQQGMTYLQLAAPSQPGALLQRFGDRINALPYTVMLDASHRICEAHLGEVDAAWLLEAASACSHP